ncbi:hypothetical protein BG005_000859 [Podila minutissima]|nr:hypothetical protein BG005_000859 [Podila minutissima]
MNSNTETWTSKVAGKTSSQGSRPEMSSDAAFGSPRHEHGHHATPMRHAGSHTESKYQVAGHVFGGRPKMMGREQPISANEDPTSDLHQPLKNHVHVKVHGPTAVSSSMSGTRSTPTTVIDLNGETSGQLLHDGNHKPYHAHPIMFESGDMYFGLSRAFFGTPQDDRPRSRQIDRQENTGSPAVDIGTFFQEPTTSSSSRPKHHVEPFNAPAHRIHATNRAHGSIYRHPTQHRPVHRHHNAAIGTPEMHLDDFFKEPAWYTSSSSGSKMAKKAPKSQEGVHSHVDHSHSSAIYKHPTQHRPVHRHHNAAVGTPEMHLDTLFQEPAWYTTAGAKGKSKKAIKKAAKKAAMRGQLASHQNDPFNTPVHLIHPVASHADSSRHVDEEGYYMNHQPIHGHHLSQHDVHMFSIPSSRSTLTSSDTSSHRQYDGVASKSWTSKSSSSSYYDEDHHSPHDDHNEEGYYMNHQPVHGHSQHHDSSHGALYKHPTQHRAVHRHHNASIGTPEMHLDAIFKEPGWYTSMSSSSAGSRSKGKKATKNQHHIEPFNAPAHLVHPVALHDHSSPHHVDEEGSYASPQPIHGHAQHHDWDLGPAYKRPTSLNHQATHGLGFALHHSTSHGATYKHPTQHRAVHRHHNAPIGTPEMHLESVFEEPKAIPIRSAPHDFCSKDCVDDDDYEIGYQHILDHHSYQGTSDLYRSSQECYYINHQPTSGHHFESHSHAGPSHAPAKNPQRKLEDSAVWNLGSLLDDTPSWAMNAKLPTRKSQKKAEDSTVWNLGSLLDETPSWAMNAKLPTGKLQRKAEDSTVWNLGSLFDDTTSVHSSRSDHTAQPSSSTLSSSSSRHQSHPLTVDQIARVAVPIGHTVTYTTVIRTTMTLMGAPSSLAHDMQHVKAEREHVLTEFSGPVSLTGQTAIWVRKESSEEMFEGNQVVCQNCRRSLSRL